MPLPPTRPSTHVVGSASLSVLTLVAGTRRVARLLHTGRDAAYLDLGGACVGVLGSRAVQVPCGVRTPLRELPDLVPGGEAVVDGGSIRLPGLEVAVRDIVDTTVPVLPPARAGRARADLLAVVGQRTADALAQLPAAPLFRLRRADAAGVAGLLGLGPGLTPLGDDVVAGWLAAAVATRHRGLARVRAAVALDAPSRTTTLSATLLTCAGRGEVVPEFRRLVGALAGDDRPAVERTVARLLAMGATSGAGLLIGALAALESLSPSPSPSPPPQPVPASRASREGGAA